MRAMQRLKDTARLAGRIFVYLLVLFGVAVLSMVVHEAGHGVTAMVLGGKITLIEVMPGIQLYPTVELRPWDGVIARVDNTPLNAPFREGLVLFLGSGSTAVVSYGLIAYLLASRPKGLARFAVLSMAIICAWDIITYSVFPAMGLRHWAIIGGVTVEPLDGAVMMGITPMAYYIGLVLHVVVANGLIVLGLSQLEFDGL